MPISEISQKRRCRIETLASWICFACGMFLLCASYAMRNEFLLLAGSMTVIWAFYRMANSYRKSREYAERVLDAQDRGYGEESDELPEPRPVAACEKVQQGDSNGHDILVAQMLGQARYSLLLRPQIAGELTVEQFELATKALEKSMALVPDGEVVLGSAALMQNNTPFNNSDTPDELSGRVVKVQRFFLDRYPVTNREYFEFVAAGGYEQFQLWDEAVLPAMLDFVDQTGHPGPRYWREGCYLKCQENRPVVGVNWHEAAAYAAWVGKRLPTDAEWVKAGCWPVNMSETNRSQRRYPWGDVMDRGRANLWNSGPERIVDVGEYPEGVSVGGVYQLIGNVWEWTNDGFQAEQVLPEKADLKLELKSIRGGAFDTYFDSQATCQFQSGESALSRRHNIGFRLAIGVCDLALSHPKKTNAATQTADVRSNADEKPVFAGADDLAVHVGEVVS